jgi:dihydroneopterin aldolase
MDKLYLKGLALKTTIDCLDWEKQLLQTVAVDIEMGIDCRARDCVTNYDKQIIDFF